LQRCRRLTGTAGWINYYPDDPLNVQSRGTSNASVVRAIPFFDLYVLWTPRLLDAVKAAGAKRAALLPFGFDCEAHRPLAGVKEISPSYVSFVGARDRERESILNSIADLNLRIYGENWDRVSRDSPLRGKVSPRPIFGHDFARVVGESAVSVNLLRAQNFGAHNMRTFEIPAMGGVMLTTRSEEQQAIFPDREAALMFSELHEFRTAVDELLADCDLRQRLRTRALKRVDAHTYDARAARMLEFVNQ
jgi:spore maturation protein CgeB